MSFSTSPGQTQQRGRADDRLDQSTDSTPQIGTLGGTLPMQTRLANIPAQVFQEACETLVVHTRPEYDDSRIQRELKHVWMSVHDALRHDPNLKEHLVDRDEFLKNVKNRPGGEQDFIKSLRDMAKNDSWEPLFDDGTLFSSFWLLPLSSYSVSRRLYYLDARFWNIKDSQHPGINARCAVISNPLYIL
jgi:hypothetical protein